MITFAKGVTSGTVPMGGVIVRKHIYDAFMNGPEHAIELFHGYTYSAIRWLARRLWLRSISIATRSCSSAPRRSSPSGRDALMTPERPAQRGRHPLRRPDRGHRPGAFERRRACAAMTAIEHSFHEAGVMIRISGDTIELTPPLIVSEDQIGEIVDKVGRTIKAVA